MNPSRSRRALCASLLLAPLAHGAAATPLAGRIADAVDRAYRPLLAQHGIAGLAVGVTVDGERHVFTHGTSARQGGGPVTAHTLFEIGSLSKTFTATLGGHALAQGALSLADPVEKHVPQLRGSAIGRVQLLHLATYTAGGLPLQFPDAVDNLDAAWDYYRAWQPAAAPGTQRRYSNPSIGLFGHAVARALRGDFTELSQSLLFPGLGLRETFIRVPASHAAAYAWGEDKSGAPVRVNPGVFDAEAYGVKTTATDLLRFVEAQFAPPALAPAWRKAVAATHIGHFRAGALVQALGWEQYPWPLPLARLQEGNAATMALDAHPVQAVTVPPAAAQATLFSKTGSTGGFGAHAAFVPQRRIGVVMLANRNFPNAARIEAAHAVLRAIA